MPNEIKPQPILLLNGWPAVGKLTTARQLIAHLGLANARLVHNHLLIDAADATLPRESPGYQALRQNLRTCILSTITDSPETFDTPYIFTEFQSDNELGRSVLAEYQAAARRRGSLFVQVNLECGVEENVRRMQHEERSKAGKYVHVENLRKWRLSGQLAKCNGEFVRFEIIDVGELQPEQTATRLLALLDG